MTLPKYSWRKALELFGKLLFILLALYLLSKRVSLQDYEGIFSHHWRAWSWALPLFFILWALNLLLDAMIWQNAHALIGRINLKRAFKTNFICYALAFITPVNSGELAGRYLMLSEKTQRQKTVFLTFWSHLPRLATKLLLGGGAALGLLHINGQLASWLSLTLLVMLLSLLLLFYFKIDRMQNWLADKKIRRRRLENYLIEGRPRAGEKLRLLLLSSLKFLTYSWQFALLLWMWGDQPVTAELMFSVLLFFTASALLPTIAIADFLVKGALALLVFPNHLAAESLLINAAFFTWIFNVALPALVGTLIILRANWAAGVKTKFERDSHYEPSR